MAAPPPPCPLPQTSRSVLPEAGEARCSLWSEQGPSQWPLVHHAFLLKQAQIRAAPASTPTGTDGRASGEAPWPARWPGLEVVSGLERAGLGAGVGLGQRVIIHSLPCSQQGLFLKTALMVLFPESGKRPTLGAGVLGKGRRV